MGRLIEYTKQFSKDTNKVFEINDKLIRLYKEKLNDLKVKILSGEIPESKFESERSKIITELEKYRKKNVNILTGVLGAGSAALTGGGIYTGIQAHKLSKQLKDPKIINANSIKSDRKGLRWATAGLGAMSAAYAGTGLALVKSSKRTMDEIQRGDYD